MIRANPRESSRRRALQQMAITAARQELETRSPGYRLSPVVALICAYNEADNIGDVLKGVPNEACGLPVTTLVVVDGGDDGTDRIAIEHDVLTLVLPVNLGHGVALWAGYELCCQGGASYVVTLDADGQNDPGELPVMLEPLVEGEADFVVGSRRLGVDQTTDRFRKSGVWFFSAVMNLLVGSHLTDTSSGYRAFTTELLRDIVGRLEQEQYQTAEVLITAVSRGWRVAERPTVWRPRASGESKKGTNVLFGLKYAYVVTSTWWRERAGARRPPTLHD